MTELTRQRSAGSCQDAEAADVNRVASQRWKVACGRWREVAPERNPESAKQRWDAALAGIRALQLEGAEGQDVNPSRLPDKRPVVSGRWKAALSRISALTALERRRANGVHAGGDFDDSPLDEVSVESSRPTPRTGAGSSSCGGARSCRGGRAACARALVSTLRALAVLLPLATLALLILQDRCDESDEWCGAQAFLGYGLLAKCTSGLSAIAMVLLEILFRLPSCCPRSSTSSQQDVEVGMLTFMLAVSSASAPKMRSLAQEAQARELTALRQLLPLARELLGAQAESAERHVRNFVRDPHATDMPPWTGRAEPHPPRQSRRDERGRRNMVRAGSSLAIALEAASTRSDIPSAPGRLSGTRSCASLDAVLQEGAQADGMDSKQDRVIPKSRVYTAAGHPVLHHQDSSMSVMSASSFSDFNKKKKNFRMGPIVSGREFTENATGQAKNSVNLQFRADPKLQATPEVKEEDAMTYRTEDVLSNAEAKLVYTTHGSNGSDELGSFKGQPRSQALKSQNVWLKKELQGMQKELDKASEELKEAKSKLNTHTDLHQEQLEILRGFRKIISRTWDDWYSCPIEVHVFEDREGLRIDLEDICRILEIPCHSCGDTAKGQELLQELAERVDADRKKWTEILACDTTAGTGPVASWRSLRTDQGDGFCTRVVFLGALFLPHLPTQWVADGLFVALVSEAEEFVELGASLGATDEVDVRRKLKDKGIDEYLLYPVSQSAVEEMVRGSLQHQFRAEYLLVRQLGRGTMGVVYRAKRVSDGDCFALKEINTRKFNKQGQGDIIRQLETAQRFQWPTLVSVLDFWMVTKDRLMYCLMPLLSGGSLESHIMTAKQDGEPISFDQVEEWYVQALHGLSYMHWRGVLHRDVKPDNLLTEGDHGAVLKIGDMGSVRELPGQGPHPSPDTWVPAAVTTPGYAGPEAHTQAVYYSGSDLWSVGATFYEVFTLEPLVPAPDDPDTPETAISELVSQFDPSQLEMGPTAGNLDLIAEKDGGLVADLPELLRADPRARPSASELMRRPASAQVLRAVLEQKHGLPSFHFDEMTSIHEDWLEACRARGDPSTQV